MLHERFIAVSSLLRLLSAFVLFCIPLISLAEPLPTALPQGQQVIHGQVNFRTSPVSITGGAYQTTLSVNASTNRSIVNYQSFNVGHDAVVNFNLPSSNSAILNRVIGGSISEIFGAINSNGKVFLVNPSGILFGSTSQVNVNSLFASTLDINNQDFLNGNFVFRTAPQPTKGGFIRNNGSLKGTELIALFASAIENNGSIEAPQVRLAVGDKITLKIDPTLGLDVVVDEPLKESIQGVNSAILNNGSIRANFVQLLANLEDNLYAHAVNNTGVVEAISMGDLFLNPPAPLTGVAQSNILISTNQDVVNSGVLKSSGDLFVESKTLNNSGSVSSVGDVFLLLVGESSLYRLKRDVSLQHNPGTIPTEIPIGYRTEYVQYLRLENLLDGTVLDKPVGEFPEGLVFSNQDKVYSRAVQIPIYENYETIKYSLWNSGKIEANNLMIDALSNIYNSNAEIKVSNDAFIKANSLINEQTGFRTIQLDEYFWGGEPRENPHSPDFPSEIDPHNYIYWLDITNGKNPKIEIGGDLVLQLNGDLLNYAGNIDVKGDALIQANNLSNLSKVLQATQRDRWKRDGFLDDDWREVWRRGSTGTELGSLKSTNLLLDLDGNFTNTGLIDVKESLNVDAQDFINGILDPNILTPSLDSGFYGFGGFANNIIPGTIKAGSINLNVRDFINTGYLETDGDFRAKARRFTNLQRTAKNTTGVMEYGGWFGGGSRLKNVTYDELQDGGDILSHGDILIDVEGNLYNIGGSIIAAPKDANPSKGNILIEANAIINQVSEGERVVSWDIGDLGEIMGGVQSWSKASVLEPGLIQADGKLEIKADKSIQNIGSNLMGREVKLEAKNLIEQNWVARHYIASDTLKLSGLGFKRETKTEHVIAPSTILATGGDIEIKVKDGTFRNTASDVVANLPARNEQMLLPNGTMTGGVSKGNIFIDAKNIEILDGVHQSVDRLAEGKFTANLPASIGFSYTDSRFTNTTQRGSNLIAGGDLVLGTLTPSAPDGRSLPSPKVEGQTRRILVQGSNLIAGDELKLSANDIKVKNGLYTDTIDTSGGGINLGLGPGYVSLGVNGFTSKGSSQSITPSYLQAKKIDIQAKNNLEFEASIAEAGESIDLTAPNLKVNGEYQLASSEMMGVGASLSVGLHGTVGVGAGVSYAYNNSGQYVEAVLNAPRVSLNSGNQKVEGTIINGKDIGKKEDFNEGHSFSGGVGFGNGSVGVSLGFDEFSFGVGIGEGSISPSVGYGGFASIGGTLSESGKGLVFNTPFSSFGLMKGDDGSLNLSTAGIGFISEVSLKDGVVQSFNQTNIFNLGKPSHSQLFNTPSGYVREEFSIEKPDYVYGSITRDELKTFHTAMEGAGFVPLAGDAVDGINGLIYQYIDKDPLNAKLSYASAIPFGGLFVPIAKSIKHAPDFAKGAGKLGGELQLKNPLTEHAEKRMVQRGVTIGMKNIAVERGTKYFDRAHNTYIYVLENGLASGKTLRVSTDISTGQVVTTTISRGFDSLVKLPNGLKRFVKIEK
jgi:filamentous hemagglutinin family protein